MMTDVGAALSAYLREHFPYSSFEFHSELIFRARKALEEGALRHLHGEMILFKPDDFTNEKYSAEYIDRSLIESGYETFVSRIIEEHYIREKLAGKFGYFVVEEHLRDNAVKAIEMADINVLLADLSIPCFDEEPFTYEISKEEVAEKLEKIGLLDYVKYMVWLSSHK